MSSTHAQFQVEGRVDNMTTKYVSYIFYNYTWSVFDVIVMQKNVRGFGVVGW